MFFLCDIKNIAVRQKRITFSSGKDHGNSMPATVFFRLQAFFSYPPVCNQGYGYVMQFPMRRAAYFENHKRQQCSPHQPSEPCVQRVRMEAKLSNLLFRNTVHIYPPIHNIHFIFLSNVYYNKPPWCYHEGLPRAKIQLTVLFFNL